MTFETKDSGERAEFSTGMQRDTNAGKARFDLLRPALQPYADQLLTRWAELMARGAVKYDARNWEKACTQEELDRFLDSADRHFAQWAAGETDEDHAAAVLFNIQGAEYVKWRMREAEVDDMPYPECDKCGDFQVAGRLASQQGLADRPLIGKTGAAERRCLPHNERRA